MVFIGERNMSTSKVPPVSIGLPVRIVERYVGQAIECLLSQSFGDFERIISDNSLFNGSDRRYLRELRAKRH